MNILFFIGNGLDINLELNTRYREFYHYYLKSYSDHSAIKKLKNSIANGIDNWSDLEKALGEYTINISSQDEFDLVFEDLGDNLSKYLELQENKFDVNKFDQNKFFSHLANPHHSLTQQERNEINSFTNTWRNHQWTVQVITFNYTRTTEKLVGEKYNNLNIGKHHGNNPIVLQRIDHIHGYTDDRRVMGVNDVSQISNENFRQNQDIIEALVKPKCNRAIRHTIDQQCIKLISAANIICIFGSSIGVTDKLWWELIAKQLKRDCILIIYDVCDEIEPSIRYKLNRNERQIKDLFLQKTELNEKEKESVLNKIYVGLNTDMFCLSS